MCFHKRVYVEVLDPKTRGLAQAKIQLAEMEMLPYVVCKTGLGVCVCTFPVHAKSQGKGCQDLFFVSPSSIRRQDAGKIPVTFRDCRTWPTGYLNSSEQWS